MKYILIEKKECSESISMNVSDIQYYIHYEDVERFKKNSFESFQSTKKR